MGKFGMLLLAGTAVTGLADAAAAEGTIAYFAATSQNGFNQATYEGVQEVAAARGYDTEILDGRFDAAVQYSQIEDALASGRYVGMIVAPNDSVGIAGAFEQVIAEGIPIGTVLFPIGPDLNSLDPQVEGITVTAASPPVPGATSQAEAVVAYCADRDPCRVVIMIGAQIFPFDNLRLETFQAVLGAHDNIEVVAVGEGYYSPDPSLQAMSDILQAHPDVDVVLSNADQHLVGVEIALGIDRCRCQFTAVDHHLFAVTGARQQPKTTAANAGTTGFDHGQRRGHRDRRIERIAARGQHFEASVGRQMMGAGDRRMTRSCRRLRRRRQQVRRSQNQ